MDKIEFLDQNILERLYAPTEIGEPLTFEDFLKLPLNDEYLKNKNKSSTINITNKEVDNDNNNHKQILSEK
jgi:hypothetical protein